MENLLLGGTVEQVPRLMPGVLLAAGLVALLIWLIDLLNTALGFKGLVSYIVMVIVAGILVRNLFTFPLTTFINPVLFRR